MIKSSILKQMDWKLCRKVIKSDNDKKTDSYDKKTDFFNKEANFYDNQIHSTSFSNNENNEVNVFLEITKDFNVLTSNFFFFYYRKPILNTLLPIAIFAPTEKIPLQTDDNKNKFSIENVVTNFCSIVYSLNLLDVS